MHIYPRFKQPRAHVMCQLKHPLCVFESAVKTCPQSGKANLHTHFLLLRIVHGVTLHSSFQNPTLIAKACHNVLQALKAPLVAAFLCRLSERPRASILFPLKLLIKPLNHTRHHVPLWHTRATRTATTSPMSSPEMSRIVE